MTRTLPRSWRANRTPPSAPLPQPAIVVELNARFREGGASNDLAAAGVLLRQFDQEEDQSAPWRGCPRGVDPSPGAGRECEIYGGRLSASLVNRELFSRRGRTSMALFSKGPGIVYNPKVARLNCVYGGDGGTRSKPEDGCGPKSDFCDAQRSAQDGWCDGRAHSPDRLADILRNALSAAINEVVINTEQIDRQLPTAVDAIFVL